MILVYPQQPSANGFVLETLIKSGQTKLYLVMQHSGILLPVGCFHVIPSVELSLLPGTLHLSLNDDTTLSSVFYSAVIIQSIEWLLKDQLFGYSNTNLQETRITRLLVNVI